MNVLGTPAPTRRASDRTCSGDRRDTAIRRVLVFGVLGVLALGVPATARATFPISSYMTPVNDFPQGLHAGDCNGDGLPDVIVADQISGDLTILKNLGNGRFAYFTSISGMKTPRGALCADFNNDGLIDVAAIDRDSGNVVIFLQKAGGGYVKTSSAAGLCAPAILAGSYPNSISVGDFDHDGNLDLVIVSTVARALIIRFGDGNGGFPRSTSAALPMDTPLYAAVADFDLDGNADIAVVGGGIGSRAIQFYMGDGHGAFTAAPTTLPSLPVPRAIAAADIDGDGIQDIAVLSNDGTVSVYLGTTTGAFVLGTKFVLPLGDDPQSQFSQAAQPCLCSRMPVMAQSLDFADFDDDGTMDLVVAFARTNSVLVLRGTGGLNFVPVSATDPALQTVAQPQGSGAPRPGTGDDVQPSTDIVNIDAATNTIDATGLGDAAALQSAPLAQVQDPPTAVLLADMNNDGIPDAVVATRTRHGAGLEVLFGNATGGYDPPPLASGTCGNGVLDPGEICDSGGAPGCKGCVPQIGSSIVSIAAADVDGDGNQDLVVVSAPGTLQLLLGNGKGQFSAVRTLAKTTPKIGAQIGDFDNDGAIDIVAVLSQRDVRGLALLHNDGAGNFTSVPLAPGMRVKGPLLAADLARGGAVDLAVGTSGRGGRAITVLLNDGNGNLAPATTIPVGRNLSSLAAADFNEDGWMDLLATFGTGKNSTTTLYKGLTGGAFDGGSPAIAAGAGGAFKRATTTIVDINDDSHQDVVSCDAAQQSGCTVNFGSGQGTFSATAPTVNNFVGRQLKNVAAVDLDGDGTPDFIGVSRRDSVVGIFFRDASGAVVQRLTLPTLGNTPYALAIGDVDGDSRPDIVVANVGTDDLTIFLNQGNRAFQTLGPASLQPVGLVPTGVGLVDLDGDGKLDVVVSFQKTSNVGLYLLKDLTHFAVGGLINIGSIHTGAQPVRMILADLNGDDIPDIVTVNNTGVPPPAVATPAPTPTATPTCATGATSTPTATEPVATRTPTPTPAKTPGNTGSLTLLLSSAVGTYSPTEMESGGVNPWAVVAADVNHDGALDLIVVNADQAPLPTTLVTFLNDGFGNFTKGTVHRRGRKRGFDICAGDFNGDGDTDVAVASTGTNDVMMLLGNGDGTWKRGERVYAVGKMPRSVACADVNGDGLTDVVFGRMNRGDVDSIQTGK